MKVNEIKELMRYMKECGLKSMEYTNNGISLKLENLELGNKANDFKVSNYNDFKVETELIDTFEEENSNQNVEKVTSPIVGVFYNSPSPESSPFVSKGDIVKKGDILCIIEAMKVMNEISAEYDMKILDIKVNNEELLEYGQIIFEVERV